MKYEYFIINEPDFIKKDLNIYIKDIEVLLEITDAYIEQQNSILITWNTVNVELFSIEFPGIFTKIFIFLFQKIVDYKINTASTNFFYAITYKNMFLAFKRRLNQFKYFS